MMIAFWMLQHSVEEEMKEMMDSTAPILAALPYIGVAIIVIVLYAVLFRGRRGH